MTAILVLQKLLDRLWYDYRARVSYAARYQAMVEVRGGKVQNDHIAFRTFNCPVGSQPAGVAAIARIFEPLGYVRKDQYLFADKHLTAWHWEHATDINQPKIFISQLEVDQLSPAGQDMIRSGVVKTKDALDENEQHILELVRHGKVTNPDMIDADFIARLGGFFKRPWQPPYADMVRGLNKESQYAAWTLLHGNAVNHFTASINAQNVKGWPDIDTTVAGLRADGMPMKAEIEGERGTKLRQSSTEAVDIECDVTQNDGSAGRMMWSYAYYELAERGDVPGPDGKPMRFQGFLGAQATNLFDMTKRD